MTKKVFFLILTIFTITSSLLAKEKPTIGRQLWKNTHISWDVYRTDDYRWRNLAIGTGYGENFDFDEKAYWLVGLDYNWGKYSLYSDGAFAMGEDKAILKTRSLSIPVVAGYQVYKKFTRSMKVYTGPVFELILNSKLDGYRFDEIQNAQFGWTVGTKFRFLIIFGAQVAYSYYPTALFTNGDLQRNAFSFSLGF